MTKLIYPLTFVLLLASCSYDWQCECYGPNPAAIHEGELLILGNLSPMTRKENENGKPYFSSPYRFDITLRSKSNLPQDVLVEQIVIVASEEERRNLLTSKRTMEYKSLAPQAFGGMKGQLSFEIENIRIDVFQNPKVQVIVTLLIERIKKEYTFNFKGKLKKISAPWV